MTSGNLIRNTHHPLPNRSSRPALEVRYRAEGDLCQGSVVDLGAAGLQLQGEKQFSAGTELELRFGHKPGRESGIITMKASVRHSQPGKMGIAFLSVRPSEQAKTLSTIRQLTTGK